MSFLARYPLPLRLVQSSWDLQRFSSRRRRSSDVSHQQSLLLPLAADSSASTQRTSLLSAPDDMARSFLVTYKPCGLQFFTQAYRDRVERKRAAEGTTNSSRVPYVPPLSNDLGDCLLHRLVDNMAAGASPILVRTLWRTTSGAFTKHQRGPSSLLSPPEACMSLLGRGLEVVASNRLNAEWVLDMARGGHILSTYQVVVHLPECVHRATVAKTEMQSEVCAQLEQRFKNPYLVEHLRRKASVQGDDEYMAPCGLSVKKAAFGLRGSFFDQSSGLLLQEGVVSQRPPPRRQRLASDEETSSLVDRRGRTSRISALFDGLEMTPHPAAMGSCSSCAQRCSGVALHNVDPDDRQAGGSGGGKSIRFSRLMVHPSMPLALYEVSTRDTPPVDIAAIFAMHGLMVVGDVAHNIALARVVSGAAHALALSSHRDASRTPLVPKLSKEQAEIFLLASLTSPELHWGASLGKSELREQDARRAAKVTEQMERRALCVRLLQRTIDSSERTDDHHQRRLIKSFASTAFVNGFGLGIARSRIMLPMRTRRALAERQSAVLDEQLGLGGTASQSRKPPTIEATIGNEGSEPFLGAEDCVLYDVVGRIPSFEQLMFLPEQHNSTSGSTAAHNGRHGATAVSELPEQTNADVPVAVVREEEVATLFCPICSSSGHAMQQCTQAHSAVLPPRTADRLSPTDSKAELSVDRDTPIAQLDPPTLPSNLHELRAYMLRGDRAAEEDRDRSIMLTHDEAGLGVDGVANGGEIIEAVPNLLPTLDFNPAMHRSRKGTPPLHRTRLRCSYCQGSHHITECPVLKQKAMEPVGSKVEHASKSLGSWCARCGARGHSAQGCPTLPEGIHTALFCSVCHKRLEKGDGHTPETCPKRKLQPSNVV